MGRPCSRRVRRHCLPPSGLAAASRDRLALERWHRRVREAAACTASARPHRRRACRTRAGVRLGRGGWRWLAHADRLREGTRRGDRSRVALASSSSSSSSNRLVCGRLGRSQGAGAGARRRGDGDEDASHAVSCRAVRRRGERRPGDGRPVVGEIAGRSARCCERRSAVGGGGHPYQHSRDSRHDLLPVACAQDLRARVAVGISIALFTYGVPKP